MALSLVDGRDLVARRIRRRLTQGELARLTGVSQATISRIEAGAQTPTLRVLRNLERQLGRFDAPDPEAPTPETATAS